MKFKYYDDLIEKHKNDSAKLWHVLNRIIGKTNNKKDLPGSFFDDGVQISDPEKVVNGFCKYFTNVGKDFASRIPMSNHSYDNYLQGNHGASLFFNPTNVDEITKIIHDLRPKKSSGHDGISGWLLKALNPILSEPLSIAINKSMETGDVPRCLKLAKVKPI